MRGYLERDWPPEEVPVAQQRGASGPMIEVLIAFLMFLLAPLAFWFIASLPGDHLWAAAVWPAGWAAAVVVLFVGNYIRDRGRPR